MRVFSKRGLKESFIIKVTLKTVEICWAWLVTDGELSMRGSGRRVRTIHSL